MAVTVHQNCTLVEEVEDSSLADRFIRQSSCHAALHFLAAIAPTTRPSTAAYIVHCASELDQWLCAVTQPLKPVSCCHNAGPGPGHVPTELLTNNKHCINICFRSPLYASLAARRASRLAPAAEKKGLRVVHCLGSYGNYVNHKQLGTCELPKIRFQSASDLNHEKIPPQK